jgi:plasmid stability protein
VKNITVSLDEGVYRRSRIVAAERQTSVSALVRDFLVSLASADEESDFDRRKRLQAEVLASVGGFRASSRVTRDEVHRRRAVR